MWEDQFPSLNAVKGEFLFTALSLQMTDTNSRDGFLGNKNSITLTHWTARNTDMEIPRIVYAIWIIY